MDKNIIMDLVDAVNINETLQCGNEFSDCYHFYEDIHDSYKIIANWLVDKDYANPIIAGDDFACNDRDVLYMFQRILDNNPELIHIDKMVEDVGLNEHRPLFDEDYNDCDLFYNYRDGVIVLISLLIAAENPIFMESLKKGLFNRKFESFKEYMESEKEKTDEYIPWANEYIRLMDSLKEKLS